MPVISIILPTYKEAPYIARSIESVLRQSFVDWELIIVDDGLTITAKQRLFDFIKGDQRIIVFSNPKNLGIQKSLNKGLSIAKGKYIARIDDDDIWIDVDKLKQQSSFLEDNSEYLLIGTGAVALNEKQEELFRYLFPERDLTIRRKLLSRDCFVHSSVLFNKSDAMYFGGYSEDETVKHIEDYDLWLKLGTRGRFYNLPIYATGITMHNNNISHVNKLISFKKMLLLIYRFRDKYPCYPSARILANIRYYLYAFFVRLPVKNIHQRILKCYRKLLS